MPAAVGGDVGADAGASGCGVAAAVGEIVGADAGASACGVAAVEVGIAEAGAAACCEAAVAGGLVAVVVVAAPRSAIGDAGEEEPVRRESCTTRDTDNGTKAGSVCTTVDERCILCRMWLPPVSTPPEL